MDTQKQKRNEWIAMIVGSLILSFGLYNVHQPLQITEGGVLGGILLINYWTGINASYISFVLDLICYGFALKYLGWTFIKKSIVSSFLLSLFLRIWEMSPPVITSYITHPLIAAIAGGLFVGIGVGIIVRSGGSSGGDDALALIISEKSGWKLSKAYLITDLSVLFLSLSYIPLAKIAYSLVTVTISSYLIEYISTPKEETIIADTPVIQ